MAHNPYINRSSIVAAASDVAAAVGSAVPYALVGGSACLILGSPRLTEDIDIVVPRNQTRASRSLLRASGRFTIDPRSQHTLHSATHAEVEILTPPGLFRGAFNDTTPTVSVNGVRVLHPVLLLNAKCGSILGRASETKKRTDAADIAFLLQYLAHNRVPVRAGDVPDASDAFVAYSVKEGYVPQALWVAAGYSLSRGLAPVMCRPGFWS